MVKLARVCYSRKELRCAAISIRLTRPSSMFAGVVLLAGSPFFLASVAVVARRDAGRCRTRMHFRGSSRSNHARAGIAVA